MDEGAKGTNDSEVYVRYLRNYMPYLNRYQAKTVTQDSTWTSALPCPSQPRLPFLNHGIDRA
jgi:hypothetical protein